MNFLVTIALDSVLFEEVLPFGVLSNHLAEALELKAGECIVVLRDNGRTASTIKDQGDFSEVITVLKFGRLKTFAAHVISYLHTATAAALKEVNGWVVLVTYWPVLLVILLYDGLLWVTL